MAYYDQRHRGISETNFLQDRKLAEGETGGKTEEERRGGEKRRRDRGDI
jgi:hypothetical protein